jgi:MFS family permease
METSTPHRATTIAGFVAMGLFWGAWASVLPDVQRATGASKGALGVALLFTTLGAIPAMLLGAGALIDRFGPRALGIGAAAFAAATTLPGLASSIPLLMLALALTGAASGTLDVAANANAARIERATGRRLMPFAHGCYSVGVLVGAVAAGFARQAGTGREPILLAVAALTLLVALRGAAEPSERSPRSGVRGLHLGRALVAVGLVGAVAFAVEGGIESWSALYLERQLGSSPGVGGLGPGVFGASMAAGRFFGQASHLSDRTLLAAGAAVSACGCALAAGAPDAPLALAGFALGGGGIALNAPIVFGAAGRRAGTAVATVTTLGYLGLLVGPPLVGGIAQAASLRWSFAVLAALAAAVAAAAARLRLD